jgi:hypothetical protein
MRAAGEVFFAEVQPLQKLRPPTCIHSALSDLPDLFP